jgi:hypothetical protein
LIEIYSAHKDLLDEIGTVCRQKKERVNGIAMRAIICSGSFLIAFDDKQQVVLMIAR